MKKLAVISLVLLLSSCTFVPSTSSSETSSSGEGSSASSESTSGSESSGPSSETSSTESSSDDSSDDSSYLPPQEVEITTKDSPILHAWDWSINDIKNSLDDIANANFKAIQLSPMQPSKSKYASDSWWNIYQPLGFKVAEGDESPIGNKNQLKELCAAAKEKDIDIIMDVVTNHLSQGDDMKLEGRVRDYEPEIYDNWLIHNDGKTNDNSVLSVVRGSLGGLPDLKTEDTHIQNRVISMLKDYVDCGVKGFRFDAAKHIETKEDGDYKSDYWDNVIDTINDYSLNKYGEEPFIYGEILYSPAAGRRWEAYTYHMSVVDNRQGSSILSAVVNNNASGAANKDFNVGNDSHPVLWAESHDTFENSNTETTYVDTDKLNLTYAIQISRSKATALYFPRPSENYQVDRAPQVISGVKPDYKSALISSANKLHNDFVGGSEDLYSYDNKVVNVRKSFDGRNEGALIVDPNMSNNEVTIELKGLNDGSYTELIGNRTVNVSNGSATVTLTGGAAVLERYTDSTRGPSVRVQTEGNVKMFENTLKVTIDVGEATESYYKINNVNKGNFNKHVEFTIGNNDPKETTYNIEVVAKNEEGITTTYKVTLTKSELASKAIVLQNVPNDAYIVCWVWPNGQDGRWVDMQRVANNLVIDKNVLNDNDSGIIFIEYLEPTTAENASWDVIKIKQRTVDYSISTKVFDYNSLLIK